MFDNDTVNAVMVGMAIYLFARWLASDDKWPPWKPKIIKGGKK